MGSDDVTLGYRPVKDAHRSLGLWPIRRALTLAFTSAVVLLVGAWFLMFWLLGSPDRKHTKSLDVSAQLELLKLVFALVAGVGALVALVTAYRRQRIDEAAGERAERTQAHAEYGQAVEQLGHDKAAVRLGGLYSLERLAQDHPHYRQTVTDVVCSYLRMPYQVPVTPDDQREHLPDRAHVSASIDAARQELQVRLTAQRLLKRHLTTTPFDQGHPPTYWDDMAIDLTGAYLVDFDFISCRPADATFTHAEFSGGARFNWAKFSGEARFEGAEFSAGAIFDWANFSGEARFDEVRFSGVAWFERARFGWTAAFNGALFNKVATFSRAQFDMTAVFTETRFKQTAEFGSAQFNGDANFRGAQFDYEPNFDGATASDANNDHLWPDPWYVHADSPGTGSSTLARRE